MKNVELLTPDALNIDITKFTKGLYINGKWEKGSGIAVFNPADDTLLGEVADGTIADAQKAVDAAAAAAGPWQSTPPRERAEILRRCFELIIKKSEQLAQLVSLENGKSISDARAEINYAAEFFRWYSEGTTRIPGEFRQAPSGQNQILVDHDPIGISILITPWNFPAAMATRKIAPALAAGCTVILKPASETPLTANALADIYEQAGVPAGVVNVITTSQPGPIVDAMLDDPRVKKLSFTGSTNIGRMLLSKAAESVVNCSMELGGNAPFIVFDDANLEDALDGAMIAKMRNAGEACTAANRIYVQKGIHDKFASALVSRMAALKVGPGILAETGCGPMITATAVIKIQRLVDDAVDKGAKVLLGGRALEKSGHFYAPTVLTNVPRDSMIARDEIFGPVAPIYSFETEEEVIGLANDTEYGLASYIYTSDINKGMRVAKAMASGMVALNRGLVSDPAAPFGGVKQSGLGREGGMEGILEFMEPKLISVSLY